MTRLSAKSRNSQNVIWLWGLGWNETARSFKSISSPWTWVALPWANGSRTSRRCQTRRRTATIKANHCKLWVRSSGQQTIYWAEASTLNQPFANTAVPCPIIEQPYEPELRVFTSHDRAPSQAPNFRGQNYSPNDVAKRLCLTHFYAADWCCRLCIDQAAMSNSIAFTIASDLIWKLAFPQFSRHIS